MIRQCTDGDFDAILDIVNDAAEAYRGVIPADCFTDPYMSTGELTREIAQGVEFLGFADEDGSLAGVMGLQAVGEVCLIRHAYVRTARQGHGIGDALMTALRARVGVPLLVGTWAAAEWAIGFYEKRGFRLVDSGEKDRLLRAYWTVSDRQIETSVVLTDDW